MAGSSFSAPRSMESIRSSPSSPSDRDSETMEQWAQEADSAPISIIIPMLNEAMMLERTLRQVGALRPVPQEVIIVDGGSVDKSVAIAQAARTSVMAHIPTHILTTPTCGRGLQMNRGAKLASGDVLCFLHADTLVPDDLLAVMMTTLSDRHCVGGGFISVMAGQTRICWGVTLHNVLKTYYAPLLFRPHLFFRGLRVFFGDQAMFCRQPEFWGCGGFDETLPLMEDADLCRRLYRWGRLRLVNRTVQVSDRRVAKLGFFKAHWIYFYIGFLWGLGVSARYLKQFYDDIR